MSTVDLEQVSRWFGNVVAVNDVTMHLTPGVTGLLGWGLNSPLGHVLTAFKDTWLFDRFSEDVVLSLLRLGAGYALAVVAGSALGVLLGRSAVSAP